MSKVVVVPEVVVIPAGIDMDSIFKKNNIKQERSKSRLRDYIYYFLSRVVTHQFNYELYLKYDGFRPISSQKLNVLFASRNRERVIKMLSDPEDPIIEDNGSYQVGSFTKGYRLTKKYRTGQIEFRTLGKEFSEKLIHLEIVDPSRPDYDFLKLQFHHHKLDLSEDFENYLNEMGKSLLREAKNEFQINLIFNKIGGLIRNQEYLKSGFFQIKHSNSNHRFTSIITMMPKELRNFLQLGGSSLVEVDLGSCQPYLLAVLLKQLDGIEGSEILRNGSNTSSKLKFSLNDYLIDIDNELINKVYPFMLPAFSSLSPSHKESVRDFYSAPFHEDFYQWMADQSENRIKRNEVKESFMYFLFDDNPNHRNHNEVIKEIERLFPSVNFFINLLHNEFGKSDFARFLQMIESHLLINLILREFHDHYPHIPIFTIHDAVLTNEGNASAVQEFLVRRLTEMTNIPPRSKISHPSPMGTILQESISKTWRPISRVRTEAQYQKLEHSIFSSNIERGRRFLSKEVD
ncbi:hypothetical protein [Algoriphagus taiwanensis]|uniref:DNA-directed RNA polymerase n=1 Tax=Algoriphagus taiwanensis TaxID=1445656 RepID=A0ABQ6Q006_9BACT|nr:hypothetical protein Ataiwa_17910 [Algoriphagus taiwanensis]